MMTKLLVMFLYFLPFIDLLTSIATWESKASIGLILKGLFVIIASIYLFYKNYKKKEYWYLYGIFIIYFLLYGSYLVFNKPNTIFIEFINVIKIFYFPFLVLFFSQCENKELSKKLFFYYSLCFLLMYLIPYPLGLGHNINEIYENKNLYLSYFYVGNELVNIFVLVLPIGFLYLKDKKRIYLLGYLILVFLMILLLGTKTMYLSFLFVIGYFLFKKREMFKKYLVIVLILLLLLPQSSLYKNIKTSLEYYHIQKVSDLLTFQNIDNVIYSNRLSFVYNLHKNYQKEDISGKIFGMGRQKIMTMKDAEIDIFDIFYSIGILGFMIYLVFFALVINKAKLKGIYAYLFWLLILISLFSGHVLLSPMTSSYLAIMVGINYNEGKEKDEILDQKSIKTT